MPDYEAINRQLRAERPDAPAAGSPEWRRIRDRTAYANLAILEALAAELHGIWESQGFPGGEWLEVAGSQILAHKVAGTKNGPDEYATSQLYVMIDGRLVYYYKSQLAMRHGSRHRPLPTVVFMPYRQRIDEGSKTLAGTDTETNRYIKLMQNSLQEMLES